MCARQMSFSAIFLLNKITALIFQIIHIRNKTSTLASKEVLNECVRSKLVFRVILLFGINVKERRSLRNEVAQGPNWAKESWENALVRINLAFVVFTPCFIIRKFLCYYTIIIKNFFDILKLFNFLIFY